MPDSREVGLMNAKAPYGFVIVPGSGVVWRRWNVLATDGRRESLRSRVRSSQRLDSGTPYTSISSRRLDHNSCHCSIDSVKMFHTTHR